MDAALVTLAGRNDGLTDWPSGTTATNEASIVAWAWAHKQAMYARAGEGDLAQEMLAGNLRNSTLENLLMVCGKIFQIEASSGTSAAIAEMLLQSDESFIEILPAIPTNWDKGAFTGLVARGNFEVSVSWENSLANKINLLSKNGGSVSIKYPGFSGVKVVNAQGKVVPFQLSGGNMITFDTAKGETYYITGFAKTERLEKPAAFSFERVNFSTFNLSWNAVEGAENYNVYVAYENDPSYTLIGNSKNNALVITIPEGKENARKTFAVTAVDGSGIESKRTLCYSNPISTDLEVYSVSWKVADGKLAATATGNDSAGFVRLYEKVAGKYVFVTAGTGLTVTVDYDETKAYALSVVSKYTDEESALMPLTPGNNENNILNGKQIEVTDNSGVYEAKIDLADIYALDAFRLYLDGLTFAGESLKVEGLYKGEWHTLVLCESKDEIAAYLNSDSSCLVCNVQGSKAYKLRMTISYTSGSISFGEITLTGEKVSGERTEYENVFAGKQFAPASDAAGNIYNSDYGYQTLTDGIIYEEYTGRYSSKQNGGKVEATIDLGAVYNLSELKVYLYKDGLSKLGSGLVVQVLFDGEWTTVVNCRSAAELQQYLVKNAGGVGDWLVFELGDVYARKLKFTIPGQTESGWTTIYEIECSGVESTVIDPDTGSDPTPDPDLIENVFENKQFVPTDDAKAQILSASWWFGGGYEALTDGNRMEDQAGRFSTQMNNTTTFMDATLDLGKEYDLYTMKFYIYDASKSTEATKKASVGKDILIQVYANGQWQDVVVCADNAELSAHLVIVDGLSNDYLEFDLGGVKAEKVRFYISGAATPNGITFQEIACSAKLSSN